MISLLASMALWFKRCEVKHLQRTCSWLAWPRRSHRSRSAGRACWAPRLPPASRFSPPRWGPPTSCPTCRGAGTMTGTCLMERENGVKKTTLHIVSVKTKSEGFKAAERHLARRALSSHWNKQLDAFVKQYKCSEMCFLLRLVLNAVDFYHLITPRRINRIHSAHFCCDWIIRFRRWSITLWFDFYIFRMKYAHCNPNKRWRAGTCNPDRRFT